MRQVELRTATNEFVAVVEVPPFADHLMPDVVMWGVRTFSAHLVRAKPRAVYCEVFAVASVTPPPGLYALAAALPVDPPPVDRSARIVLGDELAPGVPDTSDRGDGQQRGYVALSDEERARGFSRPVRTMYRHVGRRPVYPTRDLTPEEDTKFGGDFVKYEEYPVGAGNRDGRYWAKDDLESGCGSTTTMSAKLAETYARAPTFYGGTFCCKCASHKPVGVDGEFVWVMPDGSDGPRVGT